jgi:peptide/nickel transport system permease protein
VLQRGEPRAVGAGIRPTLGAAQRSYRPNVMTALGAAIMATLVLLAASAPLIAPYSPTTMSFQAALNVPSVQHLFGTDNFGRDVLSRVLHGFQPSLLVAFGSVALALAAGVPLGLAAGYFGGWVDNLIARPLDALMPFPPILLVVALIGVLGSSVPLIMVVIAVVYVPIIIRVMRGSVLTVAQQLYVEDARSRGASDMRLMFRHILPNAVGPVVVQASIQGGIAILIEAALSFIGLGTQPPNPSLGLMLAEGRDFMREAPWLMVFPGLGIVAAVLGFNLLGDGLRDALDPSSRAR